MTKKENAGGLEKKGDLSNIVRVLKRTKNVILKGNYFELGYLSNETIHSATINQDSLNIIIAVLIYSLHKVFQRENYRKMEGWNEFYSLLLKNLDLMIKNAENNKEKEILDSAGEIRNSLNEISSDLGVYIKDVFRKAEINKAFKIYEHGISSQKTAELLGVSLWELASYIGQSTISESKVGETMPEETRIKYAEEFFK